MKNIIKYTILTCVLFINTTFVLSQKIDYKNPPKQESTYLFNVLKYHRQPTPPLYMTIKFEEILKLPTSEWVGSDSLFYAYENVHLEKYELALSIFARLNIDTIQEPHAQMLYRTTLQHLDRFEMLKNYNSRTISDDKSMIYSIKSAVSDLTNAYQKSKQKTFIQDSTSIFTILKDPSLEEFNRDKSPQNNKLVSIAFAIDSALRYFTTFHDGNDYILSQAFEEMGDFQKKYFYITNAHFYYSASRHYYTNDLYLAEKYNNINDEMSEKNFIPISFKHKFGKVINNRFQIKTNFKEKSEIDSSSISSYTPPPKKKGQKDYLPWIDNSILILIILALALIFVVFILKTKKQ
ncbi:hypothetical protein [Brumimicrobium mesophilum]|uniref:hypothetical protein n=1 Tax=Brumimicrobium mesophilum TaxID=392717 RepID=UPI000D141F60|nr:hypothetical protein [Brumimicrobium mesophilum]